MTPKAKEMLNTGALTAAIIACLFLAIAAMFLVARLFYWLSGGELWGLGLLLTLVALPFAFAIARGLVARPSPPTPLKGDYK